MYKTCLPCHERRLLILENLTIPFLPNIPASKNNNLHKNGFAKLCLAASIEALIS
jgi:hypothetical protein